ncbi:MAG: VUT family protein, partial [Coxiellaceae bacterium]|nr:VUT family protein [Coxiellaceae bacterium]
IIAMLIGAVLSYGMAATQVAYASVVAFLVGETVDWVIFTYTKKPLSDRLLLSSLISSPIDTAIFLYLLDNLNWLEFTSMTIMKLLGVLALWVMWRKRTNNATVHILNTMPRESASVS